ncbi:uncharacterized protein LOC131611041 [Vicia villosa]|uniref:uncharacterized protein LOC131611041 n=1 Tax=Vicia villosa TaxID=3911 RepID=UPI00273C2AE8|nr:uncharacterized protein LOC131611041 [Vicia villosa]
MIVSWNIRGLNKVGKIKEIKTRLLNLHPIISILVETRVKKCKANKIRESLGVPGCYVDNYQDHPNGRIWIVWDDSKVNLRVCNSSSQHIHCGVYKLNGEFLFWLTGIYAHNQLELRRKLWKEIIKIHSTQTGPWCAIGDYNNVASAQDRIGGKLVGIHEYCDLIHMMQITEMAEMDNVGEHFTWSNRHITGTIYSRIDRAICNSDWFLKYNNHTLSVLPPNLSDHSMLFISGPAEGRRNNHFKFNNYLLDINGFQVMAKESWEKPVRGSAMQRLWFKLQRLKKDVKRFSRDNGNLMSTLQDVRAKLHQAQLELSNNRQDPSIIERIKQLSNDINMIHEHEYSRMRQRTKLNWIRQGDDNSKFFFAYLKTRQNKSCIKFLQKENGDIITEQNDLENEVMDFYGSLMGDRVRHIQHIDIAAMREGKQLDMDQQMELTCQVTIPEIEAALKGIGDYKSPGIDGFNAKLFKKCWPFMKKDIVDAVTEFFRTGVIDSRFNKTVVTLIPKANCGLYHLPKDYIKNSHC